ncbi:hypothetical protein DXG03_001053, partial [Asterophora parasitica]
AWDGIGLLIAPTKVLVDQHVSAQGSLSKLDFVILPLPQQPQAPAPQPTWANFNQILQGFNAMGETLQQSQELNMQTVQAMCVIMEQLACIGNLATTLPQYIALALQPHPIILAPANPQGASHFCKPRIFKGKATDVKQFI